MPLTQLPLTSRDRKIALTILGTVQTLIQDREKQFARQTLTYKELHSLDLKIGILKQQVTK